MSEPFYPDMDDDEFFARAAEILDDAAYIEIHRRDVPITGQQKRVLEYYSHGLVTHEEVGEAMGISKHTVDTHLKSAKRNLGAKTTAHACCIAIRIGLIH